MINPLAKPLILIGWLLAFPSSGYADTIRISQPEHLQKTTDQCMFDIVYPVIAEPRFDKVVRCWIDHEMSRVSNKKAEAGEDPTFPNELWTTGEVHHSKDHLSVVLVSEVFFHGTNGGTSVKTFNFDLKTGRDPGLFDVIDPKSGWFQVLFHFIKDKVHEITPEYSSEAMEPDSKDIHSFIFEGDQLVLYFDQCSIGPCAAEIIQVPIPMDQLKGVLLPR